MASSTKGSGFRIQGLNPSHLQLSEGQHWLLENVSQDAPFVALDVDLEEVDPLVPVFVHQRRQSLGLRANPLLQKVHDTASDMKLICMTIAIERGTVDARS